MAGLIAGDGDCGLNPIEQVSPSQPGLSFHSCPLVAKIPPNPSNPAPGRGGGVTAAQQR